ncbi:MAG: PA0069 family radical SAM protein [Pseudomonadota bacterium]
MKRVTGSHLEEANTRPPRAKKGRAARSNASGRYEPLSRRAFDDGWEIACEDGRVDTEVTQETPRKIINYVDSPFVDFDRSINPYRGCEHGCIYCFARPTHAYYGLSPGLDFETKLFAKPNAAELLDRELRARNYKPAPIAIGTNTDPYQPIERQRRIMRSVLQTLRKFKHPVSVLTKSSLIERDLDILADMATDGLVKAMLSVTTLDTGLARSMEPRASAPRKRLDAVRALAAAGVPTGVMAAPMIPGLNDHELESILEASRDAGAAFVGYTIIRLPLEVSGLFQDWLNDAAGARGPRVTRAIREMNGGKDYDPEWSRSKKPRSERAKLIDMRFKAACRRLGLATKTPELNLGAFRRPVEKGGQLSLFGESGRP